MHSGDMSSAKRSMDVIGCWIAVPDPLEIRHDGKPQPTGDILHTEAFALPHGAAGGG
jgi:hypothetical protein